MFHYQRIKSKKNPANLRNESSGDSNIAALPERKRSLEPDITWINICGTL